MFADFVTHAVLTPFAFFALIAAFEFTFFKTGIAVLHLALSAQLIIFGFLDIPRFTVANVNHGIFAVGNFLDAIGLAKAVTATTHSRFAFIRLDVHASDLLPAVVFALVIATGNTINSGTPVLIYTTLSRRIIDIGDVLAGRYGTRTQHRNRR